MPTEDDSRSPAERLEEGLSKLRESFVDGFPDRVDQLTSQFRDLLDGEWSGDALRGLRRRGPRSDGHRREFRIAGGGRGLPSDRAAARGAARQPCASDTPEDAAEVGSLIGQLPGASILDKESGSGALIRTSDGSIRLPSSNRET